MTRYAGLPDRQAGGVTVATAKRLIAERNHKRMESRWKDPTYRAARSQDSKQRWAPWHDDDAHVPDWMKHYFGIRDMDGVPMTPPQVRALKRERASDIARARWADPEHRRAASEHSKRLWDDPGYRARVTAAWTREKRAEASERSGKAWRERFPERAAIRDELLRSAHQKPCDLCDSDDSVMFITDYETRTFIWRCRRCAQHEKEVRQAAQRAEVIGD